MTKKKVKRKINGRFVALVAGVLLIVLTLIKTPRLLNTWKLEDLGYSPEAITAIYRQKLTSTIIKNRYYSDFLNQEIVKEDFRKDYLQLYLQADHLSEDDIWLYNRLKELKGYSEEEMVKIYANLNYYDMVALCVFDKLSDLDSFIADAKAHPATKDGYSYQNNYLEYQDNAVSDAASIEVLVNKQFTLGEYAPEKLAMINTMYAVPQVYLESRALQAYSELCTAASQNGTSFYAVKGYRSYEDQKDIYIGNNKAAKAGYYDAQTGLAVSVVASENESVTLFEETAAYSFLREHAHEYGFIFRFPENKEAVTGFPAQANYLRFVGKDLSTAIYNSGLSFDEYYWLYCR